MPYRGRFAPSPTGALHFGSLVAALASYLQARSQQGQWLVRIEDIDPPREVSGSADDILRTLDALGLHWDESVLYQSSRSDAYDAALQQLSELGLSFYCACTRKILSTTASTIYPGTCRDKQPVTSANTSIRLRLPAETLRIVDPVQGPYSQHLDTDVGDFIIRRSDGLYTYHLAVVIDDAYQGITEVVRGADLLESTPRQNFLQQCLKLDTPDYVHVPMAVDSSGSKLSKQTGALPVASEQPSLALCTALQFLGQPVPDELQHEPPNIILDWAVQNWNINAMPKSATIIT